MLSLIVPVYRNSENIPDLIAGLGEINAKLKDQLEIILVIDGSPDDSELKLRQALPESGLPCRLISLSRNFGSFAAITAGLNAGRGPFYAVLAADLQEPPELIIQFYERLKMMEDDKQTDIVFGTRTERHDPLLSQIFSSAFWTIYRRFVNPAIPEGGVDIFACNKKVRDQIVLLQERGSSLIGLLFWVGFKRTFIPYIRRERTLGKSGWSFKKKWNYFLDSFFSFTNLPVRLLTNIGISGLILSVFMGTIVTLGKIFGLIDVPGYAATILTVLFFGGLNSLGLGIIGEYVWRTFQNTQGRPNYIVRETSSYNLNADHLISRKILELK